MSNSRGLRPATWPFRKMCDYLCARGVKATQLAEIAERNHELGPVAVKMRGGRSLQLPGQIRTVPRWQKSRGAFVLREVERCRENFFSEHKNTDETIRLVESLRERCATHRKLYLSWDSAPWHRSARLKEHLTLLNDRASRDRRPRIETLPLPASAQFLNVIESVFSGMARALEANNCKDSRWLGLR